jgi:hypothetical protein
MNSLVVNRQLYSNFNSDFEVSQLHLKEVRQLPASTNMSMQAEEYPLVGTAT